MKQLYQTIDGRLFENFYEAEHHEEQFKNFPKTDKEIVEHNLAICLSNISRLKGFLLREAEQHLESTWTLLSQALPHKKSDMFSAACINPSSYRFLSPCSDLIKRMHNAVDAARCLQDRIKNLKMSRTMVKKYNEMLKKLEVNTDEFIPTELLKTPEEAL